jgi:hypothetical protein
MLQNFIMDWYLLLPALAKMTYDNPNPNPNLTLGEAAWR